MEALALKLDLTSEAMWRLIDRTHHSDLHLKFDARAEATIGTSGISVFLQGEQHAHYPHSEWIKVLKQNKYERFEIITLRHQLDPTGKETEKYRQAFDRLVEAQTCFDRGDWNGVGARCRAAWRVLKTLVPRKKEREAIEILMASVTGDPRRKAFGMATLRGINGVLNEATHLEGDSSSNVPPADLRREDALLCLHWSAAAVSYLSAVIATKD